MQVDSEEIDSIARQIKTASENVELQKNRLELAHFTADIFYDSGRELHVSGHLIGLDREEGKSNTGHGDDEAVAVSMLLRIGGQLVSAGADLLSGARPYAGAALVRQLVEIEYLAWAFETRDAEGQRWLRSTREERFNFFTPAKLRKAAGNRFLGKDYGHHCEMGGHPVPGAHILLGDDVGLPQLLLGDMLGHSGRIWDHLVRWASSHSHGASILRNTKEMSAKYNQWKQNDFLAQLPVPPDVTP